MTSTVDKVIKELREQISPVERLGKRIEIEYELYRILNIDDLNVDDNGFLTQVARRIDIGGRVFAAYDGDWKKQSDEVIGDPWLGVLALLIYKRICVAQSNDGNTTATLKDLNVLLKCVDATKVEWLCDGSQLLDEIEGRLSGVAVADLCVGASEHIPHVGTERERGELREIELTVLFYEGPIARAYLETIKSLGMKPARIVNLAASKDIATGKSVGRWLPAAARCSYAASLQRRKIHYWPRKIRRSHPELLAAISSEVESKLVFRKEVLEGALQLSELVSYSDCVEDLLIADLKDPVLYDYLAAQKDAVLLFTGGGIVPAGLLSIPTVRFLHVHPGYLPDIRGADCVLWSPLMTGRTSASSFYLSPGIDTGDIVAANWLPKVQFRTDFSLYSAQTLYRAVYAWFDPWVRSWLLRETLAGNEDYLSMPSVAQNETSGTEFHFMHDKMRRVALKSLFQQ